MMKGVIAIALFIAAVSAEQSALTLREDEDVITGGGYLDQLIKKATSTNPRDVADAMVKIRGNEVLLKKLARAKLAQDPKFAFQNYRDKFRSIRICAAGLQSWATDWEERITAIKLAPTFVVDGISSMNAAKIYLPASFYIVAEYFTLVSKVLSYWLGSIASSWTFMSYQWHSQYLAWYFTDADWRMRQDMKVLDGKYTKESAEKYDEELRKHRPKIPWTWTKTLAKLLNISDYKTTQIYKAEGDMWHSDKLAKYMPSAGAGNGWGVRSSFLEVDQKVEEPTPMAEKPSAAMPVPVETSATATIAEMAEAAQKARQELPAMTNAQQAATVSEVNAVLAARNNITVEQMNAAAFGDNFLKALSNTSNMETHLNAKLPDAVHNAVLQLNSMPLAPGLIEQFKKNKAAVQAADNTIANFREALSVVGCGISDLMERQATAFDQMKCVHTEVMELEDVGYYMPDYALEKIKNNAQNVRYLWTWFSKIFVTPESGYTTFQGLLSYLTNYLAIVASWIGGIGFTTTGLLSQPDVFDELWTKPMAFPGTTPMIPAKPQ